MNSHTLSKILGISCPDNINIDDVEHRVLHDVIVPWNKGKTGVQENVWKNKKGRYTEEHRKNLAFKSSKEYKSKEARKKHSNTVSGPGNPCFGKRWINKNGTHKRVSYDVLEYWKINGWSEGRIIQRDKKGKFSNGN